MTLKKNDARTKEIARLGAIKKNKLHPNKKWQFKSDEERTKKCASMGLAAVLQKNPHQHSDAGKKSRIFENEIASKLQGDYIFHPNEVCDRIVVRNGEVFFVEIKQPKRKLTAKQRIFKDIVGNKYQVIRS